MKLKHFFLSDKGLYCVITVLSIVVFIGIYGVNIINPMYTDWLLAGEDLSQHYLGWRAYRNSAWHFPIGMIDNLAYPNLISVIFTDSIPIFAVFFKILSPILPYNFQYFGIWGVLCFVLQGIFTGRIVKRYTNNRIIIVLCSILTVITPVMIWRMFFHTALAGQWILIYSLGLLFEQEKYKNNKKIYAHIVFIAILTSSIHIYFVLMNGIILSGYCLEDILYNKRYYRSLGILTVYIFFTAITVGLLGGFSSGMDVQSGGLGIYSYNINALFNPQGWSCIIQNLPLYGNGQYEGFAYLGIGFIFLLLACLVLIIRYYELSNLVVRHFRLLLTLLWIFIITFIISISPIITYGDKILIELDIPEFIKNLWSIFRATGRVIWICIYLLEIGMFIVLNKCIKQSKLIAVIIGMALVLQIYDIHLVLVNKYEKYSEETKYDSTLKTDEFWDNIADNNNIKHIVFFEQPEQNILYSITEWAFNNNKTVNNFYFARSMTDKIISSRDTALTEEDNDCIFIFTKDTILNCLQYNLNYYEVDDVIVGYINKIDGFPVMKDNDFKIEWIFKDNKYLNTGEDTEKGREIYKDGLSYGPYWCVPKGRYLITIRGSDIPEQLNIRTYYNCGSINVDYIFLERTNGKITIEIDLEEDVDDFEIALNNKSDKSAFLYSIQMQYVD